MGHFRKLLASQFGIGRREHNTLDASKFSHGLVADSKRRCFYATNLSRVLCDVADFGIRIKLKNLRQYQVKALQSPIPSSQDDEVNLKNILLIWFDIFNSVYFGGGLRELRDRIRFARRKGAGYMAFFAESGRNGWVRINMTITPRIGTSNEEQHIASLLHEMLHAFLCYYTCTCIGCRLIELKEPANGGAGRTGHGPAWANAMLAEAQSLRDEVSWNFDVAIERSVRAEMSESNWQPTDEELSRWGLLNGTLGGVIQRQRPEERTMDNQIPANPQRKRDSSSQEPAEDPETTNERSICRKIDEQGSKWNGFNETFASSIGYQ